MKNINKLIIESYRKSILKESAGTLVVVDVQPEYEDAMSYSIESFCEWINSYGGKFGNILFLFNGPDLGMVEQSELQEWYLNNGMEEEFVYDSDYFDKGYAFFRYCMDSDIGHDEIVSLVKYMKANDINDSRDITDRELWDDFVENSGFDVSEIRELMEYADDCISIPDVMDELRSYNNITIVGGGEFECLNEIEIALDANGQKYRRIDEWIY